jgi:hypothetical protein
MNVKNILALSLVAVAGASAVGSAVASEELSRFNDPVTYTNSRSQVQSDLARSQANGTAFHDGRATIVTQRVAPSAVSRDEVRAELARAQRNGTAFQDGEVTVIATEPTAGRASSRVGD